MQRNGFTLIEILVVLVIMGVLLVSIAIKAFPDDQQILRQEADRLGLLLEHARDEAFLSGRSIAWSSRDQTYAFWQLNAERQWAPMTNNQILRLRTLPNAVTFSSLKINQVNVALNTLLVFSPSGLNTPFAATLELHDHRVHLLGDSVGNIRIKNAN